MYPALRPAAIVPALETERLRLRAYRKDDFPICAAMWSDPVVNRYTTGKPLLPEETWAKTLRNAGLWLVLGYGYWAVEEKATGEFVGETGFADFQRAIEPPLSDMPEIGWVFVPRVHGRGYASEATRAAVAWGDEHFGPVRTACLIHEGNVPSLRLADKLGYREFRRTKYKASDVIIFTREARTG